MNNPQSVLEQLGWLLRLKVQGLVTKPLWLSRQQMEVLSCQEQHICGCLRDAGSLNEAGNQ